MFGPWLTVLGHFKSHVPTRFSSLKPNLNFITIHYLYLIGWTLLGSIILYPGGLTYIDALFFASGSATQSGLNTVDLNKLYLYQQVVIMLIACVCNPIFINSFVVFVRLYWFERRFQNVVQEARNIRRTRTRSRTKSEARPDNERDIGEEETGVGSRPIIVLRAPDGTAKGHKIEDEADFLGGSSADEEGPGNSLPRTPEIDESPNDTSEKENTDQPFTRNIVFADEVRPESPPRRLSNLDRLPQQRSPEHHISFVENQRNPKDKATLRIPGPRDFDRGFVPQRIEDNDEQSLEKELSNEAVEGQDQQKASASGVPVELNADDHPFKRNITIDEPDHPRRPGTGVSAFRMQSRSRTNDMANHLRQRGRSRTFSSFISSKTQDKELDPMPYLSWQPTLGRNSAFIDLTEEQREELGGIEYRSLKLLAIILVCYFVGFHLLGMICLLPWAVRDKHYSQVIKQVGVNPVWWGFFTPASLFNDLGFTLTPDSMISFQLAVFPILLGTFLIIIGNTGFPCMLRFIIWLTEKCVPRGSGVWEELRFLLDHPRRCFTLLFPSDATWWLFWVLVLLNGIDLIFFIILDLNDPTVTSLPPGFRVLAGLFQAASTRTAGFSVVNLADLHPATQVSYLVMMYISVFPIAISMRRTNVYEEKSLGVWGGDSEEDADKPSSYVGTHLRLQLSFDLWFVFLGFFLISIIEGRRLENTNDYAFTLFSLLFEIVSAYGTVGLSLGYPGLNASFSGQFKPLSKLIMIAMQIRGRHRGLPYALDRAILLPSESLHKKEDEDAIRRAGRRNSMASDAFVGEGMLRRRGSAATAESTGRSRGLGLTRLLSGALTAGPTIPREKRA